MGKQHLDLFASSCTLIILSRVAQIADRLSCAFVKVTGDSPRWPAGAGLADWASTTVFGAGSVAFDTRVLIYGPQCQRVTLFVDPEEQSRNNWMWRKFFTSIERFWNVSPLPYFTLSQTLFKIPEVVEGKCPACRLPFQQAKEPSARLSYLLSLICQNSQSLHVFATTPFGFYFQVFHLTDQSLPLTLMHGI